MPGPGDDGKELTWEELCMKRKAMWYPHVRAGEVYAIRTEAKRNTFPEVLATHPEHGTVRVRARSKCDAVRQAAKAWGVPFGQISGKTEVWRNEP